MSKASNNSPTAKIIFWANKIVHFASMLYLGEWGLYGALRCPFVVPFVSCQNCPVLTCPGRIANFFWGFWGFWIALGVLCGRAFCGWFCPGGMVNRIFSYLPSKAKLHEQGEKSLPYLKYILLIFCIWAYFVMDQPRVNVPLRIGEFIPSALLTYEHAFPMWLCRLGLIVGGVVLTIFVSSAWCRFLCPAGGLLELIRRYTPLKVYKTESCNNCNACKHKCYMNTRPDEHNCTNCGDCLGKCPSDCIKIGFKKPC